jgi:hypothetical protein
MAATHGCGHSGCARNELPARCFGVLSVQPGMSHQQSTLPAEHGALSANDRLCVRSQRLSMLHSAVDGDRPDATPVC